MLILPKEDPLLGFEFLTFREADNLVLVLLA